MAESEHSGPSRVGRWAAIGTLVAIVGLSAWIRTPGFTQGGFASHDVAGILHGAMVLLDGGLPYVDTVELKAPGTFYLATVLAGPAGTDIARFQVAANLWALASLVALAVLAWRLWNPRAAVVAAALYALHDAHLDSMDANYVTWAQLPLLLGMGTALLAPRAPSHRRRVAQWLLAGVLLGVAALCKRPAGVGMVAALVLSVWPHHDGDTSAPRWHPAVALVLGAVLAHVPIAIHYASAGQLGALVDGYVENRWGLRYVQQGGGLSGMAAVAEGVRATAHVLVLPLMLAAFALVPSRDRTARRIGAGLWAWALVTLAAAWVGFRFYKGYFTAVAPPLCLLAAAPWGLTGAARRVPPWLRVALLLPAFGLVLRQAAVLDHQRSDRARPHDQGGRVIATVVGRDQRPGDRIWVWGWHLWDVYPLTGMRSASRVYKSLGLLTPPNDDTWRTPAKRLRFVDGPAAQILLEDLRADPPAWIVLGSTVPRHQFKELRALLAEHYTLERKIKLGRVQFWHRKDRARAQRQARRRRPR